MPSLPNTKFLFIALGANALCKLWSKQTVKSLVRTWTRAWLEEGWYEPFVEQIVKMFMRMHRKTTVQMFHQFLPEIDHSSLDDQGLNYTLKEYREMIEEHPFSFNLICIGSHDNYLEDTSSDIRVAQIIELLAMEDFVNTVLKKGTDNDNAETVAKESYKKWLELHEIPHNQKKKLDELLDYFTFYMEPDRLSKAVDILLRYEYTDTLAQDNEIDMKQLLDMFRHEQGAVGNI